MYHYKFLFYIHQLGQVVLYSINIVLFIHIEFSPCFLYSYNSMKLKLYPMSKFYTLNILGYSCWVFHILLLILAVLCFLIFTNFYIDKPILGLFNGVALISGCYIFYFWFILTVIAAGILEIIFRKLGKINGYNQINGNKQIADLICLGSIAFILLSYYIFYRCISLLMKIL